MSDLKLNKRDWAAFSKLLKAWYHPDKRKLPWKNIDNAYYVWVSEVFLQQTQADRVVEFFLRFTSRFPTVEKLAKASFEEALPYFRGLGFYGRLRRMLETARAVVTEHGGIFPNDLQQLEALPGVGPYTARAVASFAYGQKVLAPDTNVNRILGRFFGEDEKKWVMKQLDWFDEQHPKDFNLNQVLMDFGSQVCLAREPKCQACPLLKKCVVGQNPERLLQVVRKPKVTIPRNYQKVVVGILIRDRQVLVSRRRSDQSYAGLLEFPGGRVEAGEDERGALRREFLEEVGVDISVRPPFEKILQKDKEQVLSFHRCRILTGEPRSMEGQEVFGSISMHLIPRSSCPRIRGLLKA